MGPPHLATGINVRGRGRGTKLSLLQIASYAVTGLPSLLRGMARMDTEQRLDPRQRELKPERIVVGDEVFIRNDVLARSLGESERSLNRADRLGAPYRFFGGVKSRPERLPADFVMRTVPVRKPPEK